LINPELVENTFLSCLFKEDELDESGNPKTEPIIVEGIQDKIGFNAERILENENQIIDWLKELPIEFRKTGGGGWSFLNACNDKDGNQWTGFHKIMDQLFMLGQAIKKVSYQMPRDMWEILPSGMPYIIIDL